MGAGMAHKRIRAAYGSPFFIARVDGPGACAEVLNPNKSITQFPNNPILRTPNPDTQGGGWVFRTIRAVRVLGNWSGGIRAIRGVERVLEKKISNILTPLHYLIPLIILNTRLPPRGLGFGVRVIRDSGNHSSREISRSGLQPLGNWCMIRMVVTHSARNNWTERHSHKLNH